MSHTLQRVFVYGTLKRGEPNHHWFTKDDSGYHKFICRAKTIEKYPLIIATKYNIPFLLHSPGNGKQVHGEIYEVDDKVLVNLDILEDHPRFYERQPLNFTRIIDDVTRSTNDNTATSITAWIYFIKRFKPSLLIDKTFYESYSNNGDHGLKYVDSDDDVDLTV